MRSPRWRKLRGDIEQAKGRLLMMVIAIAVGVFAAASISTAYTILTREIVRNFLSSNPAVALLDVDLIDQTVLGGVRAQAGITGAEAAGQLTGRIEVSPNEWLPLLLFVVPDFRAARISTIRLEAGRWPSAREEIILERTAVSVANTAVGRQISVQTPHGTQRSLTVVGVVHDPSLAPAWQEQTVYGYVTPATLTLLGEGPSLHLLKVTVKDASSDPVGVERAVIGVADWLRRAGHSVGEIRIPPYQHPHQGMMTSVVRMLLAFSLLTLILSAILTATLTSSLLAPQVRQIGVMKAIGARTAQIMQIYVGLIAAIGILAVAIGLPFGIAAGRALAQNTARMLNLELASRSVPAWLYGSQVLIGVGLPLAAALLPIKIAAGRTARETLSDFGVCLSVGPGPLIRWFSRLSRRDPAFVLAIRNTVRRKSRLALTLGLLATAGAMFMTSLNVKAAWQRNLAEAGVERHFDAELKFAHAQPEGAVVATVSAVPGVRRVEPWSVEAVSRARDNSGIKVTQSVSQAQLGRALGGHLFILIGTLVVMSMPMATVGIMGLGSAMTISVLERTREIAVMRAIGARAWTIRRTVIGEAVLVGVLSAGISLVLSVPLTIFVDWIVGTASFGPALGTGLSAAATPLWLVITVVGAVTASAYPSWKASKLTIREALGFQ